MSFLNCNYKERAEGFFMSGLEKYNKKDYSGAISDFNKAIGLDKKDIKYYYWRGEARLGMKKYKSAIHDFSKCIDLDSRYYDIHQKRGIAKFYLKDYRSAIKDFDTALKMVEYGDIYAYYYRGMCKFELGDIKAGCKDICWAKKEGFGKAIEAFDKLNCVSYIECKKRELTEEERKKRKELIDLLEKLGEEGKDKN